VSAEEDGVSAANTKPVNTLPSKAVPTTIAARSFALLMRHLLFVAPVSASLVYTQPRTGEKTLFGAMEQPHVHGLSDDVTLHRGHHPGARLEGIGGVGRDVHLRV